MGQEDDYGCRCTGRQQDVWRKVLYGFSAAASLGLLCLGAMMVFLPLLQEVDYDAVQVFGSVTQGLAIMMFSFISFLESIYSTKWVRVWFGFLSYTAGRLAFYITIGIYALPVLGNLRDAHEEAQKALPEAEKDNTAAVILQVLAFIGIICAFLTGFLQMVYAIHRVRKAMKDDGKQIEEKADEKGEKTEKGEQAKQIEQMEGGGKVEVGEKAEQGEKAAENPFGAARFSRPEIHKRDTE